MHLFLLCFTLLFHAFFAFFGMVDYMHDVILFKPALDLLEGKMLYRESFHQYGPVPILLSAAGMSVFGKLILVVRLQMVVFYGATAFLLYAIWKRFLDNWSAAVAVVLWNLFSFHVIHTFLPWASGYALFFQMLALYSLIRGIEQRHRGWVLGAGVCTALTLLCKQNVGLYLAGATALLLVCLRAFRSVLPFAGGFISGFLPFLFWFKQRDALPDWFQQCFVWPRQWASGVGDQLTLLKPLRDLLGFSNVNEYDPDWLFTFLPLMTLAFAFFLLGKVITKRQSDKEQILFTVCAVSLASWLQYFPMPGVGHLWWSATPMFGIFVYLSLQLLSRSQRFLSLPALRQKIVFLQFLLILCLFSFARRTVHAYTRLSRPYKQVHGENAMHGIFLSPVEARYVERIAEVIDRDVNRKFSQPSIVLDHDWGLPLALVKNNKNFHPVWDLSTSQRLVLTTFQDLPRKVFEHVSTGTPIIFTKKSEVPGWLAVHPGYEVTSQVGDYFVILSPKGNHS